MKTLTLLLIPMFLQTYDEIVKKLADDLTAAETAPQKVGVGDDYVKLSKKYPKKRQELLDAASDAYAKAWSGLDPVWQMKSREHLAKIYAPIIPGRVGTIPEGWSGPVDTSHKVSLSNERVHSGGVAAKLIPGSKARNARLLYTPTVKGLGKKIEFSVWVLSDGTDSTSDEVRFYFDGSVTSKAIQKDTPAWTRLIFEVDTVGGSIERGNIEIVSFSKTGTIWVDDLSIKIDGKEQLQNGGFEK